MAADPQYLLARLNALRTELADLAFTLERRGRLDAADLAVTVSARVAEICDEFIPAQPERRLIERLNS
jgi:hypothetical protein